MNIPDDPMQDDVVDDDSLAQINEYGEELEIKDPIYDIMSDSEIADRSEGLLGLLDEYEDKKPQE